MRIQKMAIDAVKNAQNFAKTISVNPVTHIENPCIKVVGITQDTFCPSSLAQINKLFKNVFKINSEINDLKIAQKVLDCVKDFCKINQNDGLFEGLTLKTAKINSQYPVLSHRYWDKDTKTFKVIFNENFDWDNISLTTKNLYNYGFIPSENPKFLLYKELGHFLIFKNNPQTYESMANKKFINQSELWAKRLGDKATLDEFGANFIAGRMCEKAFPDKLKDIYEVNGGNKNLIFPSAQSPQFVLPKMDKASDEIIKYLREKYSIEANFINQEQANLFLLSIEEIGKIINAKNPFKGLKIKILQSDLLKRFDPIGTECDINRKKAQIVINPLYSWKSYNNNCIENYHSGFRATINPQGTYFHELAHYLEFITNSVSYIDQNMQYIRGYKTFNDFERTLIGKVSVYAATNPAEFNAEYVAARMEGKKFPALVNNLFNNSWKGPALNFDLLTNQ